MFKRTLFIRTKHIIGSKGRYLLGKKIIGSKERYLLGQKNTICKFSV